MNYVGIDLHKTTISVCCMNGKRQVLGRRRSFCKDTAVIEGYFRGLGEFQMVVEATASYEWLFGLIEPLARKAVLAHPKKLRLKPKKAIVAIARRLLCLMTAILKSGQPDRNAMEPAS